ncbi:MAG: hypothetical protein IT223_00525, partial [Crocinitomicaceae bacterium]|nr:hypothetical protein [Crocinitomicaceae bacterium]
MTAQGKIRVKPANGINTASDDVVCGFIGNDLIVATNDRQDMVNDFKWNEHKIFRLKRFKRGADYCTYTSIGEIFAFNSSGDEGTACYDKADSILYFSSTENYGKGSGTNLKLYSAQWNGSSWKEPELLSFCTKGYDYTHPVFDQITGQMVFSSNKPGGRGGMDIWYTYRSGKNWTEPENLGILVNTAGHEIFPTLFHGDIYFSSNGLVDGVGFDLFRAVGRDQWKISIQLPEPYNSAANDLRIFFVNKYKGFITSDRKGSQGG